MFTLPQLNYSYDALEPYIDTNTMQIHHTKHHQTYIDKLNAGLSQDESAASLSLPDLVQKTLQLPLSIQGIVRNHGGGHINHSMFRELMTPNGSELQVGLKKIIEDKFGSIDGLKEDFNGKALALFGSGWTWLILNTNSELEIKNYSNQDNPYMFGEKPILGIDLREHAYYLGNQNRRNEYLAKRWNIVNRNQVEKNLQ